MPVKRRSEYFSKILALVTVQQFIIQGQCRHQNDNFITELLLINLTL